MSWGGAWGANQQWGSNDSWSKGGDSWSKGSSQGKGWDSAATSKGSAAPTGKGGPIKVVAPAQAQAWKKPEEKQWGNESQAWKKPEEKQWGNESWGKGNGKGNESKGKGNDSWSKGTGGGGSWGASNSGDGSWGSSKTSPTAGLANPKASAAAPTPALVKPPQKGGWQQQQGGADSWGKTAAPVTVSGKAAPTIAGKGAPVSIAGKAAPTVAGKGTVAGKAAPKAVQTPAEKALADKKAAEEALKKKKEAEAEAKKKEVEAKKKELEAKKKEAEQKKKEAEEKMKKAKEEAAKKKLEDDKLREKKLEEKKKAEIPKAAEALSGAKEKLEALGKTVKTCLDAEMPFMTGVEVLPADQSEPVLKECQDAATAAFAALNVARSFIKSKTAEIRGYEKELREKTLKDFEPLEAQLKADEAKVQRFRKETTDRKTAAAMQGCVAPIVEVEKQAKKLDPVEKELKGLEDASLETIKACIDTAKTALAESMAKKNEAQKVLAAKQKEAKATAADPAVVKLTTRLTNAQIKVSALQAAMNAAEKIVRARTAIADGEEKVKEAEKGAEKVQKMIKGAKFTVEKVAAFEAECATAMTLIRTANSALQPHLGTAPEKEKALLQALLDKKVEAQKAVETAKADTKADREEVLCDDILKEAEKNTKAVETAAEEMESAEKPFLIGKEFKVDEMLELIETCNKALGTVKNAIAAESKYAGQKKQVSRQYGEAPLKKITEGFSSMAERVRAVNTKMIAFDKELKARTKAAKMLEAAKLVEEFEAAANAAVALAEPFTKEGAESMSEADAAEPLKAFLAADAEVQKKMNTTRNFLIHRQKDQAGNADETENVKKMQERIQKAAEPLTEVKKATAPHEQRSLGTRLLAEAKGQVEGLPDVVKKASEACGPLLEDGGAQYLVGASVKTLFKALQEHMKKKEMTVEAIFKEAAGKSKGIKEADFKAYLAKLPEAIGHDELSSFTDERHAAMFKAIASDGKAVKLGDFEANFRMKHSCVKPVTLTDKEEVEGGETLVKVEPGTTVELFGLPKEDEAGLVRSQCTVGDKTGWITLRQTGKGTFLHVYSPFQAACSTVEKVLLESSAAVQKVNNDLTAKLKQGGATVEGPLKEAREEMTKLKDEVAKSIKEVDELRKKVGAFKREYQNKERTEANAHIEARNQKEAAPFVEGPKAKTEAAEAAAKAVEDAAAPLAALTGEDLENFSTPVTVIEAAEKAAKDYKEKAEEARAAINEQTKAASEVTPQSGGTGEAKRQLKGMAWKLDALSRKSPKIVESLKAKTKGMVDKKIEPTWEAIRKYMQKEKLSGDALFTKLKDGDKIPEAAFCKLLESLEGMSFTSDIAKLIFRKIQPDGISKDTLMTHAVLYYKVVKSIVFTDVEDVSSCKTLRRAEQDEVLEVLEGPNLNEGNGMTRIRAKACSGAACEGWVTISGTQGTAFLEKCAKP